MQFEFRVKTKNLHFYFCIVHSSSIVYSKYVQGLIFIIFN